MGAHLSGEILEGVNSRYVGKRGQYGGRVTMSSSSGLNRRREFWGKETQTNYYTVQNFGGLN